jgi:hypothetical protein
MGHFIHTYPQASTKVYPCVFKNSKRQQWRGFKPWHEMNTLAFRADLLFVWRIVVSRKRKTLMCVR